MSYGVALRNGVPFTLGTIAALCTNATSQAFNPLVLWPDGIDSPGMWISPRDLTSQWQDYTGTTPVATPGTVADSSNPVGLALDIRAGATTVSDPGNHMLQATSAARPLESAYDGQTLGPGNTYDATGYPVFQLYDGVDDGMATATFAAGTLINGMDCMIPVRRDSAATASLGIYGDTSGGKFTGYVSPSAYQANYQCGTPTTWVNGVQVAGGTSVTQDVLDAAVPVGEWCILEFKGLDLSGWTFVGSGAGTPGAGYLFPGARGDILLYPSTASTEDKDAARQWLADYYGVTLP